MLILWTCCSRLTIVICNRVICAQCCSSHPLWYTTILPRFCPTEDQAGRKRYICLSMCLSEADNSSRHSTREMARAPETVEHLLESQDYFGNGILPFTRRGLPESRKNNISVRLNHNEQVETVEYRRYRTTDHNYATLRIDGLTYIVMALPRNWKRGDKTQHHGGCRFWFAWQGPRQQFLGQRFEGPVAVSTSSYERYYDIRSESMSSSRLRSSHTVIPSSASPLQRSREPSPSRSELDSSSASSDYIPTSKIFTDPDEQEPTEGRRISTRRTTRSSMEDPCTVLPRNTGDPSQALMPQEETAIWMRICVIGEEGHFRPMFLSSARPSSDIRGSVTHKSLFEKVTRVCTLGKAQIQHLEVIIDERAIFEARHSPNTVKSNQISFRVGREEEESWHFFVICLKDHIAQRHGCDGWHLVILAHVQK